MVFAKGLSAEALQGIRNLEAICSEIAPLNMKLNWDMLEKRSPDEVNDFLYYEGTRLIGFLGLYALGGDRTYWNGTPVLPARRYI